MFHSFILAEYCAPKRECNSFGQTSRVRGRTLGQCAACSLSTFNFQVTTRSLHPWRMPSPVLQIELPGIPKVRSGKVRELFDLGDAFLMVATDRISAFDCIMPDGIPRKGEVLTQISHF